jgi:hypothetical protein
MSSHFGVVDIRCDSVDTVPARVTGLECQAKGGLCIGVRLEATDDVLSGLRDDHRHSRGSKRPPSTLLRVELVDLGLFKQRLLSRIAASK